MRASTFFKSSTIALVFFALTFIFSLYWIVTTLSGSRQHADEYQLLKNLITVDFNRVINKYLQTGDATLLSESQEILTLITATVKETVQNDLTEQIFEDSQQLQQLLNTKFRALGKLSGDPQMLLRTSEQSISALTHQLAIYAQQSVALNEQQKLNFIIITEQLSSGLTLLINARERALSIQTKLQPAAITQQHNDLVSISQNLLDFPLLDIMEIVEVNNDDFSFEETSFNSIPQFLEVDF